MPIWYDTTKFLLFQTTSISFNLILAFYQKYLVHSTSDFCSKNNSTSWRICNKLLQIILNMLKHLFPRKFSNLMP